MISSTPRPTVAALVVNYNYERFVGQAIESVLSQKMPFDEVLVVDDGSTDGSVGTIESYDDRVRLLRRQNGGQLSAVLEGAASLSTDYVYVMDSDDLATPDLHGTVQPLLAWAPVKVQFQLHAMDEVGRPLDSIFPTYAPDYGRSEALRDNEYLGFSACPPTSANVFRVDFLRDLLGAGLNGRDFVDGVPAQIAPYFGGISSINEPLARYRVHGGSDSQWGSPTPALLRKELRRFDDRWQEGRRYLASRGQVISAPVRSAYVTEREIMIAVLSGRRAPLRSVHSYTRSVAASSTVGLQKIAFLAWAGLVLVTPSRTALHLVVARRSSRKRGPWMTAAVRLARRLVRR